MKDVTHIDVAVIGAGPAGLMAAEVIATAGHRVVVYDAMPSAGRKFLMAGRGGLNLTHSETLADFLARYRSGDQRLGDAIAAWPPHVLRDWSAALGQETFVGSSGRVFPKAFKASPLLRAWLRRLDASGITFAFRHRWQGWDDERRLLFETADGPHAVQARATVLALGGASWPRLGSNGAWVETLATAGVGIAPLRPANCGFTVAWSERFRSKFAGQPLKGIALSSGGKTVRGEIMLTERGLEGGAVYALSSEFRADLGASGVAVARIALRPDLSDADISKKIEQRRGKASLSNHLRKVLHLAPAAIGLLQESAIVRGAPLTALSSSALAATINDVPVPLAGIAPVERAISTAGGITFDELDDRFMLSKLPGVFAAGEMLDWDAPTGGYLLQASFATGTAAGRGVVEWLAVQ